MISKNKFKLDVLGTCYTVKFESDESDKKLEGKDGYCDTSIKKIVIRDDFGDDINNLEDLESYQEKVIRHEIIHAFLHESGLDSNCGWATEEAVDWFALQFYKITNAIDSIVVGS